jgi:hypothetical protein
MAQFVRLSNMDSSADRVEVTCACRTPSQPRLIHTFFVGTFTGFFPTLLDPNWKVSTYHLLTTVLFGMITGLTWCVLECIFECICESSQPRAIDAFCKGFSMGFMVSFLDPNWTGSAMDLSNALFAAMNYGLIWAVIESICHGCIIRQPPTVTLFHFRYEFSGFSHVLGNLETREYSLLEALDSRLAAY